MAHRKSSAGDRVAPTPYDALVVFAVLALAALLALLVFPRAGAGRPTAIVTVSGETVAVIPLGPTDTQEEPSFLRIDCDYPLVLEYRAGSIRVSETTCPGQDCLHQGAISSAGEQIICLPNRLIIRISGEFSPAFDAITG